jgi:hypothetical protein
MKDEPFQRVWSDLKVTGTVSQDDARWRRNFEVRRPVGALVFGDLSPPSGRLPGL